MTFWILTVLLFYPFESSMRDKARSRRAIYIDRPALKSLPILVYKNLFSLFSSSTVQVFRNKISIAKLTLFHRMRYGVVSLSAISLLNVETGGEIVFASIFLSWSAVVIHP